MLIFSPYDSPKELKLFSSLVMLLGILFTTYPWINGKGIADQVAQSIYDELPEIYISFLVIGHAKSLQYYTR